MAELRRPHVFRYRSEVQQDHSRTGTSHGRGAAVPPVVKAALLPPPSDCPNNFLISRLAILDLISVNLSVEERRALGWAGPSGGNRCTDHRAEKDQGNESESPSGFFLTETTPKMRRVAGTG